MFYPFLLAAMLILGTCVCVDAFAVIAMTVYDDPQEGDLERDLCVVSCIDRELGDCMPVTYDYLLEGGYFAMPSARMGASGEIGLGYTSLPPYNLYNLRAQLIDRLEVTGSYRVFKGVDDPILSPFGFGDFSDKGANAKFAILHPEDSEYRFPGLAVGIQDFMGTRAFAAEYIVLTQVLLKQNLEISLGYGGDRINGLFGGILWMPFRQLQGLEGDYLKGVSVVAEWDANNYTSIVHEPHPDGREKKTNVNFGLKYRLWDMLDLSFSRQRGVSTAMSVSAYYNFGETRGLPKIDDPEPYTTPAVTQPLGIVRTEEVMIDDYLFALREQGFWLREGWISHDYCGRKALRLRLYTENYRHECDIRNRLSRLMAFLTPSDIDSVIVVIETEALPVQEYRFEVEHLASYREGAISAYELAILSPLCEASVPDPCTDRLLFQQPRELFEPYAAPDVHTVFGSSTGKFKYSAGIAVGTDGFLWGDVYYSVTVACRVLYQLHGVGACDLLNPSQIINVRSDNILYLQDSAFTVREAYIQKNWNMGCGWYSRASFGIFELAYGGVAGEILYYPVGSNWAVGIEGAYVRKRNYSGIGFNSKIRQLEGYCPTWHRYQIWQGFFDVYYHLPQVGLDLKIKAGHFLAGDTGVRCEVARYFPSGLKLYFWYTYTNYKDYVNGQRYFDKGIGFSMPLDMFFTFSSRRRFGYDMSAWLRDVGATAYNGTTLYELIHDEREE